MWVRFPPRAPTLEKAVIRMAKELLFSVTKKDLEVQTFRSGGKGGQNQNKRDTGVRIIHRPSGAVGEARDQRSQLQNRRAAFNRLVSSKRFVSWLELEAAKSAMDLQEVKRRVDEQMDPKYLKVEYF
jgi:protein subunit release factor A